MMVGLTNMQVAGSDYRLVRKIVVFDDTTGVVPLFDVYGDVIVHLVAICQVACVSVGGCDGEVGTSAGSDIILPATDITSLVAGYIWHDGIPDSNIVPFADAALGYVIGNGADILLSLSAQADAGEIAFYCFWRPLSAHAEVRAA